MEPVYKGFQDLVDFYANYGYNPITYTPNENMPARKALGWRHNHTCWLNPIDDFSSKRTRRLCKKFWKNYKSPQSETYMGCDVCPNFITYYKNEDDFLFALGNSFLYKEQGKIK